MASSNAPKKANLLDHNAIKTVLDESVTEILTSVGHVENHRLSNMRVLMGTFVIGIALFAQFYRKKDFPRNTVFLLVCVFLYVVFYGLMQLMLYTKQKDVFLYTYPPAGSFTTTGLVVTSTLPRFSDMYTLTIASADPKSVSANEPVHLTKSVTEWFTKDGILVEGRIWKDVEALLNQYTKEPKKNM